MVEPHTQKLALCVAIGLTTAAIARVGIWRPLTPRPAELNPTVLAPLREAGWSVRAKLIASDGATVSSAGGFELVDPKRHPGTVVKLAPVRAIGSDSYTIATLMVPVLGSRAGSTTLLRFGNQERVRVHSRQQRPARAADQLEAACLNNGLLMASSEGLVRTELAHNAADTVQQRLAQVLGLRQPRNWDCLLVAMRQPAGATKLSGVIWTELAEALRSWDQVRS